MKSVVKELLVKILNNVVVINGALPDNTELNNITRTGVYNYIGTMTHGHGASQNGNMLVLNAHYAYLHQIVFIGNEAVYIRRKDKERNTWNAWRKINTVA